MASALIGGGISLISNLVAGDKAANEAAKARAAAGDKQAQAMLQMREAVLRLEQEGIPSVEAQKIVLQQPELVGLQEVHQLATSEMSNIEEDPRLRSAQMQGLDDMQKLAATGMTEGEQAQQLLDQTQVAGEEQARRKSILRSMAERGAGGGGQELAALLSSSQGSAQRRAMQQAELAKAREARKLAAMQQAAQLGTQIRGQEFSQASQVANAQDAISKFNLANRMNVEAANLANRQRVADEQTRLSNVQEQYNKQLLQQDFRNRMDKAKSIAGAKTGTAQQQLSNAQQDLQAGAAAAQGQLQQGAAIGNIATGVGSAISQMNSQNTTNALKSRELDLKEQELGLADGGLIPMTLPPNPPAQAEPPMPSPSPSGYAGGGVALITDDEEIIPGDSFEGDRVDAKINSGEMVLNVEQQQRLMDLLKGYRSIAGLGDENIVEKPPIDNPDIELPQNLPSMPPPSAQDAMPMADGGVAKDEDDLGNRLLREQRMMQKSEMELKDAQKRTRARIKALETLTGTKS